MRSSIVVAGSIAQKPMHGGHTWVFPQYLLGLRRLGWDVTFLDRLDSALCLDATGRPCAVGDSANLRYLSDIMAGFDLADAFAISVDGGTRYLGLAGC